MALRTGFRPWLQALPCLVLLMALLPAPLHGQAASGQHYAIDPALSQVYWLVYRAGILSGLGHDHVISAPSFSGSLLLSPEPGLSAFSLRIPVTDLVVDDPGLRQQLGQRFQSQPSAGDIETTRSNMLGPRLLDAENHDMLEITGTGLSLSPDLQPGQTGAQTVSLSITLAGNTTVHELPVEIAREGDSLIAMGKFSLSHEALGLRPFRALFGALQVAGEMDFSYRLQTGKVD